MKAFAIDLAGRAGVAAPAAPTLFRRWHVLLGALLLALAPATAGATETEEWPTASDRGPRTTKRIPWMTFSGDPNAPVLAAVPGHVAHGQQVVVVREREPTRRERRLLRRADRLAEKAARLRAKAGTRERSYAMVVPVVQVAPPPPPRPRPVIVERARPQVHVVHLESQHEHDGCHDGDHDEDEANERHGVVERRVPVVIDGARISADVERQVARALRDAEKARARAMRAHEKAEREAERAERRSRR